MRRVLVSGAAGFIASHLTDAFVANGDFVIGVDDLSGGDMANLDYAIRRPSQFKFYQSDLANYEATEEIFRAHRPEIVMHFAAQAHEGASFYDPYRIVKSNSFISAIVFELAVKYKTRKVTYASCLDQESRLVTTEGIKRFSEIKTGDRTFSINPVTKLIEEDEVKNVFIYDYRGEMLDFHGKRARFLVTPDHRMFIVKAPKGDTRLTFERAHKTFKRAFVKLPTGNWGGKDFKDGVIEFPNYWNTQNSSTRMEAEDFFYLTGLFIADGVANKSVTLEENKTGLSKKEYLSLARDEKGKFKTVGKIGERAFVASHHYGIRYCVPRGDKARARLEATLNKYGIKWRDELHGQQVSFSDRALHDFFKECGDSAHEKHIPQWMLQYSVRYLMKLWEGIIDGDGHRRNGGTTLTTVSWFLVRDCVELGIKIGRTTTFKFHAQTRECVLKDGRRINGKGAYYISFGKTEPHIWRRMFKKIEEYNGKVWCVETRNGNFLMEKDGRIAFTGNSMSRYGMGKPPFTETMKPKPVDPYGVSKIACEEILRMLGGLHGIDWTIVVPRNVFGPRQSMRDLYRNFMAISMNRILRGEPIVIYGKDHIRSFSYIEDSLPAFVKAADFNTCNGEVINIGGLHPVTVLEAANEIMENFKEYSPKPIQELPPRYGEVEIAYCSSEKSVTMLGYEESIGWKKGVAKMAAWAKAQGAKDWRSYYLPLINEFAPEPWREFARGQK